MGKPGAESVRSAVRERYTAVAAGSGAPFPYPTGREGVLLFGYDAAIVDGAPEALVRGFCGVGNPFSLGAVESGAAVLDVGCGSGFDMYAAFRLAGEGCRILGIDSTPAMIEAARSNLDEACGASAGVRPGSSESIPYAEGEFDLVVSNGVLNLSPEKERSIREIRRVLRPGGALRFADVVLRAELPSDVIGNLDAWTH